jgi:hypothetical protein
MNKIIFFNTWHNGDIHVSREFIKDILSKVNCEMEYHHNNSDRLLLDLNIKIQPLGQLLYNNQLLTYFVDDVLYINIWYNSNTSIFKIHGCTLNTLYNNFVDVYKLLNIQINDISYYIPSINYKKFKIDTIDEFINNNKTKKKIYISNNNTCSGQSVNFNFTNIVNKLSIEFPEHLFILSNKTPINNQNVLFSSDIIKLDCCDLCENSYLTTFTNIVIGRCSGPFTFSLTKEVLLSETKQTFIGICNIDPKFGIEHLFNINKEFLWFNFFDEEQIYEGLKNVIVNT